jgi:hypothetical protein
MEFARTLRAAAMSTNGGRAAMRVSFRITTLTSYLDVVSIRHRFSSHVVFVRPCSGAAAERGTSACRADLGAAGAG